jgi:hypothetical protein
MIQIFTLKELNYTGRFYGSCSMQQEIDERVAITKCRPSAHKYNKSKHLLYNKNLYNINTKA